MKYNCDFCKQYWEFLREPYWSDLKDKDKEVTKDVTLFCPACKISKVRKDRWTKKYAE